MNLSNIIVQGGLAYRAGEDYGEQQDQRAYATKARALGVKKMDAEGALIDQNTQLSQLKQQIEANELEFKKTQQPTEQATAAAKAGTARTAAESEQRLAPGAATLAAGAQGEELQNLRGRQTANIWQLLKMGDKEGAVQALTKSEILQPGRKFKDIQRGSIPLPGKDGKPQLDDKGQPIMEPMVQLVPADDGPPVFIPEKKLDASLTKYNTSLQKVDKNLVRVGPGGEVTPVYEPDNYKATGEGDIFNGRTGQPPPAAGGIPGAPGAGARPPSRKVDEHFNNNVKMAIDKVLLPKYGGKFEGGMFFPDDANKDVALRASVLTEQFIRQDRMDPVAAANKAVETAEREKALANPKPGGGTPAAGAYTGPTPWKR